MPLNAAPARVTFENMRTAAPPFVSPRRSSFQLVSAPFRNEGTRSLTTNAVGIRRQAGRVPMAVAPWIVSDELWELVEPLLPVKERRFRYPGRKRLPDRQALQGDRPVEDDQPSDPAVELRPRSLSG
jgi:hypothetical protein